MSETIESLKAKYGPSIGGVFGDIEFVRKVQITNTEAFLARCHRAKGMQRDVLLWKYERILDSLVYGNSFIGNDYFVLRYVAYELLLFWTIFATGLLSEQEADWAKIEVETKFYLYLNCIYNIKEKFERLTNLHKGEMKNTVLEDGCPEKLLLLFKEAYQKLEKPCEARRLTVHGVYEITLIADKKLLRVASSSYDLLSQSAYEQKETKLEFLINSDAVLEPVAAIHHLTSEVLSLLSNLDNVDPERLATKFIRFLGDGVQSIGIG
jgi:hypothetical protein